MELPELCSEANTLAGAIVLQLLVSAGRELVWQRRGRTWRQDRQEWEQRERVYIESLRPPHERQRRDDGRD